VYNSLYERPAIIIFSLICMSAWSDREDGGFELAARIKKLGYDWHAVFVWRRQDAVILKRIAWRTCSDSWVPGIGREWQLYWYGVLASY